MVNPQAFLVVGHSQWGKSKTLWALTNDQRGWVTLDGKQFFVRLMSNNDVPDSYEKFINSLGPIKKPLVIAAYCPERPPYPFITALAKKYNLILWILEHNYADTASITPDEIQSLHKFGKVECYSLRRSEAVARASALMQFIQVNAK
jgi:hypothetical protein